MDPHLEIDRLPRLVRSRAVKLGPALRACGASLPGSLLAVARAKLWPDGRDNLYNISSKLPPGRRGWQYLRSRVRAISKFAKRSRTSQENRRRCESPGNSARHSWTKYHQHGLYLSTAWTGGSIRRGPINRHIRAEEIVPAAGQCAAMDIARESATRHSAGSWPIAMGTSAQKAADRFRSERASSAAIFPAALTTRIASCPARWHCKTIYDPPEGFVGNYGE